MTPGRLLQGAAIGSMIVVLVAAFTLTAGVLAVQRRVVTPQTLSLTFGDVTYRAFVTNTPNCRTPGGTGVPDSLCAPSSVFTTSEYFAVWRMTRVPRGSIAFELGERLFIMRLGERPEP